MRLTFSTDYALRLLILVGLEQHLVTIEEVADRFGISKNHLMKVAYQLGQAGYLKTIRGRKGGLRLGKAPHQIVVGEVVRKMEPDFAVVECQNPEGYCKIAPCCTLRSAMGEAVQAFLEKLDEYTLEDLLRPKSKLRHLLGVNWSPCPGPIRAETSGTQSCVTRTINPTFGGAYDGDPDQTSV
jgi:Rrf2 family transcriptional regulator, nitric oxide-sensitive transcriptional repressor